MRLRKEREKSARSLGRRGSKGGKRENMWRTDKSWEGSGRARVLTGSRRQLGTAEEICQERKEIYTFSFSFCCAVHFSLFSKHAHGLKYGRIRVLQTVSFVPISARPHRQQLSPHNQLGCTRVTSADPEVLGVKC